MDNDSSKEKAPENFKVKKKPFNHVLEVQNGFIDVNDIIRHIDKNLPRILEEKKHGKAS